MIRSMALPLRLLAAAFAVAALAGCVKKQPTEVSPSYAPEGAPAQEARLIVYPNLPTTLFTFFDKNTDPQTPNPIGDSLISTAPFQDGASGIFRLMLFDGTQASAFELLRREQGGGYFSVNDFLINPARKWIDGQREVYVATDPNPSSFSPATYMMRGVVGGQITEDSPLTNAAIAGTPTIAPITYAGISAPNDSLFTVAWNAVNNAAGYWVHVYQFLEASRNDQVLSGIPAPAYVNKVRDYFLGYVPAPNTSYKLGTAPADVDIFTRRLTLRGQVYLVRIAAVDANGALIAYSYGDFGLIPGENLEYTLFPLGAFAINVRSGAPQTAARPLNGLGDASDPEALRMGDLRIVRAH